MFFGVLAQLPVSYFLLAGVAGVFVFLLALSLYRISLHPLTPHPGPLPAKLTSLYSLHHALLGDRHLDFHRLHTRYGPIVRYGPNQLSFNTAAALKDIYGFGKNVGKARFYDVFPAKRGVENTHNTRDKAVHGRKRRVLSQAFGREAERGMEGLVLGHVRTFVEKITGPSTHPDEDEKPSTNGTLPNGHAATNGHAPPTGAKGAWTPPRNMSDWCNYLTFDIMGDLAFGQPFRMLTTPTNRFALHLVGTAAQRHLICGTYPLLHRLGLDKLLFPAIAAGRERYMAYSAEQSRQRTALGTGTGRKDFFAYLLEARDRESGVGFSERELWGESNLLIIAGSDTTSTALAGTFFYLSRHPDALARVTAEVRGGFRDAEEITPTAATSLPYLRACIDEALRLAPPVPGALPREVGPGGARIDGHFIPEGVEVSVPTYAIHHNPLYFPDPYKFDPSRWLLPDDDDDDDDDETSSPAAQEEKKARVEAARAAFCPFSVGPRGCIGKGLAYGEVSCAVARTVWEADFRVPLGGEEVGVRRTEEGGEEEFALRDKFTSWIDGPVLEFRRRG